MKITDNFITLFDVSCKNIEMVSFRKTRNNNRMKKYMCGVCCYISQLYYIDCGHVLCKDCGINDNTCPYCKKIFTNMKKIYFM